MSETKYIWRAPLLDSTQHVLGYKLACQNQERGRGAPADEGFRRLLNLAPLATSASSLLFLDAGFTGLPAEILKSLTPASTVLMLTRDELADESTRVSALSCRGRGFGIGLCGVDLDFLVSDECLLSVATHAEVSGDHPDLIAIARHVEFAQPQFSVVVKNVSDWHEFDACAALGLSGFFGDLCRTPRKIDSPGELGPQAALVIDLMQMVRENADVRDLEKVLKCDATLSYTLLRYINSASFGMGVEIESLRHALSMLGYTPLYRWLSIAGNDQYDRVFSCIAAGRDYSWAICRVAGKGIPF